MSDELKFDTFLRISSQIDKNSGYHLLFVMPLCIIIENMWHINE